MHPTALAAAGPGGAAEGGEASRRGPGIQVRVLQERSWYLGELDGFATYAGTATVPRRPKPWIR